ncbi:MAG TPA: 30S ribosomal protein S16 [Candidatus Aminicenantes bacterium]|nr:30S ribosomal protein S16 [Candidatus Aminicenantes bacterium]
MVSIRLMRMGAKKRPFYRVIVTDSRSPRESKYKESLGYYNPLKEPAEIKIDLDRLSYWLERGAQASETVQSLIKQVAKRSHHSNNIKT